MEAKANDLRLVYSAKEYSDVARFPTEWDEIFGDGNFSAIISGASGSGKDAVTGALICKDIQMGRTVIILDLKMEYSFAAFCQMDSVLINILNGWNAGARGYKVNLWIPYTEGLNDNEHFKFLISNHHPNIRIRPFRILNSNFVSEDAANMSLQKTYLQSIATKNMKDKMHGNIKNLDMIKEEAAKQRLGIDEDDIWYEGCGWEYLDFKELCSNKQINVISTYFMLGKNTTSVISLNIAMITEMMTVGKRTDMIPGKDQIFSVVIPELQYFLMKIKSNKDASETLMSALLGSLLLMRSFDGRLRINLQNLSALYDDMFAQSRIFVSRTNNPRDFSKLKVFSLNRQDFESFKRLPVGAFVDLYKKRRFSVVPFFHKARQREHISSALKNYKHNPAKFLFPTANGLLSEIIDADKVGLRFPCTVKTYNQKVKSWLENQKPIKIDAIDYDVSPPEIDIDDVSKKFEKLKGKV